jgi:hypothetical protein
MLVRRLRFICTALPTVITLITIIPLGTYNTSSWYIFLRDDATPLVHLSSLMTAVCLSLLTRLLHWTGLDFLLPFLTASFPHCFLFYSGPWVEFYVTTDGQPASLSWNKAPIWGLRPELYYMCDSYGLVLVGRPLWREDGSVFYIWCWPLPAQSFFGPSPLGLIFYCLRFETSLFVAPTTRRVTVEVFDPASTRGYSGLSLTALLL